METPDLSRRDQEPLGGAVAAVQYDVAIHESTHGRDRNQSSLVMRRCLRDYIVIISGPTLLLLLSVITAVNVH